MLKVASEEDEDAIQLPYDVTRIKCIFLPFMRVGKIITVICVKCDSLGGP